MFILNSLPFLLTTDTDNHLVNLTTVAEEKFAKRKRKKRRIIHHHIDDKKLKGFAFNAHRNGHQFHCDFSFRFLCGIDVERATR